MIDTIKLIKTLKKKINFFVGVPDSVLKNFSNYLENSNEKNHIVSTNEGSAVAFAIGRYLATKKVALVYMQNSGLSNALNPLISIAHKKVYSIPIIMLIGWRGAKGTSDEVQHNLKGAITKKLLDQIQVKSTVINKNKDINKISKLINYSIKNKVPVAFLVKKNTLKNINKNKVLSHKNKVYSKINRQYFLERLLENTKIKDKIVSSTGYLSRELNQLRKIKKYNGNDFYMVGGMGHTSMVSLGISMSSKNRIICLDGDGSLLMHLGAISLVGSLAKNNLKYILLNNFSHESVGGQPCISNKINFKLLSKSVGFKQYLEINQKKQLDKEIKKIFRIKKNLFVNVIIQKGSMPNLGRPKNLHDIKETFMKNFKSVK